MQSRGHISGGRLIAYHTSGPEYDPQCHLNWVWWGQKDQKFKVILNYVTSLKVILSYMKLYLKKPQQKNILQGLKERKLNLIPQMVS